MTDADLHHTVATARLWAATRQPYLASALFALSVQLDAGCDTIAVDRAWNLHADPAHLARLPPQELGALLLHLVGHLLRDHADRAARTGVEADNQREWWNRCADAEINDDLQDLGIVPASAPDLPHDLHASERDLAERYYESAPTGPRRWDCGSGV